MPKTVHGWLPELPVEHQAYWSAPKAYLCDSLEPAFLECVTRAARRLVATYPKVDRVVVRAHNSLITLMLLTCSQHEGLSPSAEPASMHIKIDDGVDWSHVIVEAMSGDALVGSLPVYYTPGLNPAQNEVFTKLLDDGFTREKAAEAAALLS